MELLERKLLMLYTFIGDMKAKLSREDGATAVEYGLLVALIAAGIIVTVVALREQINCTFQTIVEALKGTENYSCP